MPLTFYLLLSEAWTLYLAGYIIAILNGFTDILDGYLARKFRVETKFGQFLDPVADKIFVIAYLLYFLHFHWVPFWFVVLVLMREIIMTEVRAIALSENFNVKVNQFGKLKTLSQNMLLLYTGFLRLLKLMNPIVKLTEGPLAWFQWLLLGVAAFMTAFSLISYLWQSRSILQMRHLS